MCIDVCVCLYAWVFGCMCFRFSYLQGDLYMHYLRVCMYIYIYLERKRERERERARERERGHFGSSRPAASLRGALEGGPVRLLLGAAGLPGGRPSARREA